MSYINFNESVSEGNLRKFNAIHGNEPFVLLLYSSSCPHCHDLKRPKKDEQEYGTGIWDSTRKIYQNQLNVVEFEHAVLNHLMNDHSGNHHTKAIMDTLHFWEPRQYPTIMIFDAKALNPTTFSGERNDKNIQTVFKKSAQKLLTFANKTSPVEKVYNARYKKK